MDWMWLVMGLVLGSLTTSVLIWAQQGTRQQDLPPGYFARVAMSTVITSILAGLVWLGMDYLSTGGVRATGIWFGTGWLVGGLIAGWFVSNTLQRRS